MRKLSDIGRIFYGIAVAATGSQTVYYHDFPYWLLPSKHNDIPGLSVIAIISGALLLLAGICIIFKQRIRSVSLVAGTVLFLVFCFYHVPYQVMTSSRYMHLLQWENAEKELAFASGALVIAGCFPEKNEAGSLRFLGKVIPLGPALFSIPVISFGILHFLYAKDVADYVPSWMPARLFWTYFAGTVLIGSGLAILLKIKSRPAAAILGAMIFSWFIVLHIPRVAVSPVAFLGSEVTSAFLALAYSGIAFVIGGIGKTAS